MKLTLILVALISATGLVAQPTLEMEPDSLPGTTYQDHWTFEADEIVFQVPTGTINQYYNFRDVDFELTGPQRTWKVASEASKYNYFPDATLCYTQNELSLERFFRLDADSNFVEIGHYYLDEGKDVFEFLDDPAVVALTTASLGSTIRDTILARVIIDGDTSMYQNVHEKSIISWGSVNTPENIYVNCLIQEVHQLDSLGNIRRINYSYFHENLHNRVLNVTLGNYPSDEIFYMIYRSSEGEPVSVAGIGEVIENIYLSGNHLIVDMDNNETLNLTLFDVSGKIVYRATESVARGKNILPLNINLVPAYYFLLVVDQNGNFHMEKLRF